MTALDRHINIIYYNTALQFSFFLILKEIKAPSVVSEGILGPSSGPLVSNEHSKGLAPSGEGKVTPRPVVGSGADGGVVRGGQAEHLGLWAGREVTDKFHPKCPENCVKGFVLFLGPRYLLCRKWIHQVVFCSLGGPSEGMCAHLSVGLPLGPSVPPPSGGAGGKRGLSDGAHGVCTSWLFNRGRSLG